MLSVSSGKLETGRVEAPTAGSCFHFHPFRDDVGTPVVLDVQCLPSCIKYKDSLTPLVIHSLRTGGCRRGTGECRLHLRGRFLSTGLGSSSCDQSLVGV